MENNQFSNDSQEPNEFSQNDFETHKKNVRNQKIAIVLFSIVSLSVVGLGFSQMGKLIKVPLPSSWGEASETQAVQAEESIYDQTDQALKAKDTDEDNINDYEELYIYKTSPYLADSDSDGIDDYEEIMTDQDPNCPVGQDCFNGSAAYASSDDQTEVQAIDTNVMEEYQDVTPDQLREILISSGVATESELALYDDETLMEFYYQSLEQVSSDGVVQDDEALLNQSLQDASNPSADRIREMLMDQGFTAEELAEISDEVLLEQYQEALEQVRN